MSYHIIKALIEKKLMENSHSVNVYKKSRKCVALALIWLLIAFINGMVILFMGIFFLPDSFAVIIAFVIGNLIDDFSAKKPI